MSAPTTIELLRYRSADFLIIDEYTADRWIDIDHFRPSEFYGYISKISAAVILALDEYRKHLNCPIYISPANWGEHSSKSYHSARIGRNPHAWAVDIYPDCSLAYAREVALKMPFWGAIGTYPYWQWPARNLTGGLHLDIRHIVDHRVTWWRDAAAKIHYFFTPESALDLARALAA